MTSFASPRVAQGARAKSGFTLVELLTVIAIIGILAAIIIPVVGSVRNSAKSANCATNLRQLGVMCTMFASENRGRMPSHKLANGLLDPYYYATATAPKSYTTSQIAYSLWPYYSEGAAKTGGTTATSAPSQIKLLFCPSFTPTILAENALYYVMNLNTATGSAAGYNVFPYGGVTSPSRMITSNLTSGLGLNPSKVWLMQDYDTPTGDESKGIAGAPHHQSKRNRLYMDGSVRSLPLADSAFNQF